jgi:hypothetical protein
MAMSTELIAANYTEDEICRYIEADKVIYQDLEDLEELFSEEKGHGGSCFACFSGKYPTGDVTRYLRHIQEERASHRSDKDKKSTVGERQGARADGALTNRAGLFKTPLLRPRRGCLRFKKTGVVEWR